jgi:Fe-S cluster assembly protein SufD
VTTDLAEIRRATEAAAALAPGLAWLADAREQALAQFLARGLPTTADEDWRYTDLGPIATRITMPAVASAVSHTDWLAARRIAGTAGPVVALLDGMVRPEISDLDARPGLLLRPLADATPSERGALAARIAAGTTGETLASLNAALLRDGLLIEVGANTIVDDPIYIVVGTGTGVLAHNRILLSLSEGAQALVIEHHLGAGVSNSVTDLSCAAGSRLNYIKLQDATDEAIHLATQRLSLGAGASADLLHLDLGARLGRNDLQVDLAGHGSKVSAHGLFFADGERHLDNHTRMDHRAPQTVSRELYRGIADGRGRGVFNGKVIVHAGATGTDAQLRSQNLLLSTGAEIDTKPELEIYADEVKCSHGATTGQLDPMAIFYLRSRGIPADEARRLLIAAFAREIVARLPAGGALAGHVLDVLRARLPAIGEVGGPS